MYLFDRVITFSGFDRLDLMRCEKCDFTKIIDTT